MSSHHEVSQTLGFYFCLNNLKIGPLRFPQKHAFGATKNLLRAFRAACHYGDGDGENLTSQISIASSHVFNRVMLFALREMDGILRALLGIDGQDGKAKGADVAKLPRWRKMEPLVRSYVGNALHVLNQVRGLTSCGAVIDFCSRRAVFSLLRGKEGLL